MSRRVFVSLLPSLVDTSRPAGSSAVVIDVLRASTTVCAALHAGAARVIPFATVEDARRFAERMTEVSGGRQPSERPLLGGERSGVKIDGFDLGNSPLEYTPQRVAGRTIVFTTTNGTRALLAAGLAERVYMGAFANLDTVADRVAADSGDIHLICAGTDGQVTLEDALCAGELATALSQRISTVELGNDEAALAVQWSVESSESGEPGAQVSQTPRTRLSVLRSSLGGRNLVELGYDADIEFAARIGTAPVVPVYRDGALVIDEPEPAASDDAEWAI